VTITILENDFGFMATIDPSSVSAIGLLQPKHGTISINSNGTILYTPNIGYSGLDTFEYRVCSTPSPIVCDDATVIVKISTCPSNGNQNVISGQVFVDRSKNGINDDGGIGMPDIKVLLYTDGDCNGIGDVNELTDSVTVDSSGFYQFVRYPEKTVEDNFEDATGASTCASGSDGDSPWAGSWTDQNDPSVNFCNNSQSAANTDVEIVRDGAFGYGIRLKGGTVAARRSVNLNGATKAFLTFSYRRKNGPASGEDVLVQASANGGVTYNTIFTIAGDGTSDAAYTTVYNQDITSFAASNTSIRFMTNGTFDDNDTVYIDNVAIRYLKYPQCYITAVSKSSIPAYYDTTTVTKATMTIAAGGSCTSHFDFGMAKNSTTISGTLRNDKNGLQDGNVNGTGIGNPNGATVYAYLVDVSGNVAYKTVVNSSTGAYSFPLAEVNTEYTMILSTDNTTLGAGAPNKGGLNTIWARVGDAYGNNNGAGSGAEAGTPDLSVTIRTGTSPVLNVDFGIQRLPNSDSYLSPINQPRVNQVITLNGGGNPPILSGSDPEDCNAGCVLTTHSVMIDQVPVNAELYYNSALVSNGQRIDNFNPGLFQLKITPAGLGDTSIIFNYSYVDAAMMKDPTPATYKLIWLIPLPADGLTAVVSLDEHISTIKWSTLSEQNTSHFVVERSLDNKDFSAVGSQVAAAGNSADKREYQLKDDISGISQNTTSVYYRVKLVDLDGKTKYSNVVVVRLSGRLEVSAWPNPFQSVINISVTTDKSTTFDIRMMDVSGKLIRKTSQAVSKGTSQIALRDLEKLPGGIYLIELRDEKSGSTTVQRMLKN
jgi:hypothetical protein